MYWLLVCNNLFFPNGGGGRLFLYVSNMIFVIINMHLSDLGGIS